MHKEFLEKFSCWRISSPSAYKLSATSLWWIVANLCETGFVSVMIHCELSPSDICCSPLSCVSVMCWACSQICTWTWGTGLPTPWPQCTLCLTGSLTLLALCTPCQIGQGVPWPLCTLSRLASTPTGSISTPASTCARWALRTSGTFAQHSWWTWQGARV